MAEFNHKEYRKKYYIENKEKIDKLNAKYKDKLKVTRKKYRDAHKEEHKEYSKKWIKENYQRQLEKRRLYKQKRKDHFDKAAKEYRNNNREKIKKIRREWQQKKRKSDPTFKLKDNLRRRLTGALKNNSKRGSGVRDLGCSINYLKLHLEVQFQKGMTWDNYGCKEGQWSIDHIYPISKVDLTDREQLLMICNYENLRPMWHIDNIKKRDKII